MHDVKAGIPGLDDTHKSIGIGSVVIQQTTGCVHQFCNGADVFVKQTQRIGIGQHQPCGVGANQFAKSLNIYTAPPVRRDFHHFVVSHHRTGWIRPVS